MVLQFDKYRKKTQNQDDNINMDLITLICAHLTTDKGNESDFAKELKRFIMDNHVELTIDAMGNYITKYLLLNQNFFELWLSDVELFYPSRIIPLNPIAYPSDLKENENDLIPVSNKELITFSLMKKAEKKLIKISPQEEFELRKNMVVKVVDSSKEPEFKELALVKSIKRTVGFSDINEADDKTIEDIYAFISSNMTLFQEWKVIADKHEMFKTFSYKHRK